jgi:Domain of unknown function (DUF4383)
MAKTLAVIFGVVFVLVGILGFIPNPIIYSDGAIFLANGLHSAVHFLVGVILLIAAAKGESASSLWLKIFGVVYLLLAIIGFIQIGSDSMANLLGVVYNGADNWLHLVLGIVLLALGLMGGKSKMDSATM